MEILCYMFGEKSQLCKRASIALKMGIVILFVRRLYMPKKGVTGEQDRSKPQPKTKKERNDKRKEKKAARLERQMSR